MCESHHTEKMRGTDAASIAFRRLLNLSPSIINFKTNLSCMLSRQDHTDMGEGLTRADLGSWLGTWEYKGNGSVVQRTHHVERPQQG